MKIMLFSDMHGAFNTALNVFQAEKPDLVLFLGDDIDGLTELKDYFFGVTPCIAVNGNCDRYAMHCDDYSYSRVLSFEGFTFYITHGHREYVKSTDDYIMQSALAAKASVVLHGHTHSPRDIEKNGIRIINPGAMLDGRYAILTIENNELKKEFKISN